MVQHYSRTQIGIHWLTALLVLIVMSLVFFRNELATVLGGMGTLFMLHKSLGLTIGALTIVRVVVNMVQGVPRLLPPNQQIQHLVAKSVQYAMVFLLLTMPLAGLMMVDRPTSFFNLFVIQPTGFSESARAFFHGYHVGGGMLLGLLILVHFCAALYHQFIVKDNVMHAMLSSR